MLVNQEKRYIKEWIQKILDLYNAHKRVNIDNYEPRMEELLRELLGMAIEFTESSELTENFEFYYRSVKYYGIIEEEEYKIFKIIGDVLEMVDKD